MESGSVFSAVPSFTRGVTRYSLNHPAELESNPKLMPIPGERRLDPFPPGFGGIIPPADPDPEPIFTSTTTTKSRTQTRIRTSSTIPTNLLSTIEGLIPGLSLATASFSTSVVRSGVTPATSVAATPTLSSSNEVPQTSFVTAVYSQPTAPPSPSPVPDTSSNTEPIAEKIPILSIALIAGGATLLGLIILFRLGVCCVSTKRKKVVPDSYYDDIKESPLFGGSEHPAHDEEKFIEMGSIDTWNNMQASLGHGMGRMSTAVFRQGTVKKVQEPAPPLPIIPQTVWNASESPSCLLLFFFYTELSSIRFPGSIDSAGLVGAGTTIIPTAGTIQPSYSHEQAYGHSPADAFPTVASAPTAPHAFDLPASESDLASVSAQSLDSFIPDPVPITRPLNIKRPENNAVATRDILRPIVQPTGNFGASVVTSTFPQKPLHSILKQKQLGDIPQVNGHRSDSSDQRYATQESQNLNTYQTAMHLRSDPKNSFVGTNVENDRSQTHQTPSISHYRPTSRRPVVRSVNKEGHMNTSTSGSSLGNRNGYSSSSANESSGREFPHGLEFPLPPSANVNGAEQASGVGPIRRGLGDDAALGTQIPYASSSRTVGKMTTSESRRSLNGDNKRTSAYLGSVAGGALNAPPVSPSLGFANVGNLMMKGFLGGDSEVSGDESATEHDLSEVEDAKFEMATATSIKDIVERARQQKRMSTVAISSSKNNKKSKNHQNRSDGTEGHSRMNSNYQAGAYPRLPPPPIQASVPSILITATPSTDSIKALNRRLSKALELANANAVTSTSATAIQSSRPKTRSSHTRPENHSASQSKSISNSRSINPSNAHPLLPPSLSRFDSDDDDEFETDRGAFDNEGDESDASSIPWGAGSPPTRPDSSPVVPSLAQMALERAQPNYRSATYSIYNMYNDGEGDGSEVDAPSSDHDPSLPLHHSFISASKPMTLSTIYSGYDVSPSHSRKAVNEASEIEDYNFAGSFAKEVGARLDSVKF